MKVLSEIEYNRIMDRMIEMKILQGNNDTVGLYPKFAQVLKTHINKSKKPKGMSNLLWTEAVFVAAVIEYVGSVPENQIQDMTSVFIPLMDASLRKRGLEVKWE